MPHLELIVTTAVTGVVSWLIKTILDAIKGYTTESRAWRKGIDKKMDDISDATQATMRTQILHYAEKYLTRGWMTSEERAALCDMHSKYAALNANGYIDGYMARVAQLPDKETRHDLLPS